jgi:hypothetical protein
MRIPSTWHFKTYSFTSSSRLLHQNSVSRRYKR